MTDDGFVYLQGLIGLICLVLLIIQIGQPRAEDEDGPRHISPDFGSEPGWGESNTPDPTGSAGVEGSEQPSDSAKR